MKPPRTIATPSPFQEGGPVQKIDLTDWELPEVTEGPKRLIAQMKALIDEHEDKLTDYKNAIQAAASEALRYTVADAVSIQMFIADYEGSQTFTGDALRAYVRLPLGPELDEPEWEVSFRDVITDLVERSYWRGRAKYLAQVRDDLIALADIIDASLPPAKRRGTAPPAGNG